MTIADKTNFPGCGDLEGFTCSGTGSNCCGKEGGSSYILCENGQMPVVDNCPPAYPVCHDTGGTYAECETS